MKKKIDLDTFPADVKPNYMQYKNVVDYGIQKKNGLQCINLKIHYTFLIILEKHCHTIITYNKCQKGKIKLPPKQSVIKNDLKTYKINVVNVLLRKIIF